jgi:secreted PhoX family phosphatase
MSDDIPTPGAHDGMAAFRDGRRVRLVRNHEQGNGTPFAPTAATYDPLAAGGTTTLVFDPRAGALVEDHASLSGTVRNCAGGPNPAGWLTCEETRAVNGTTRHGYIFQVPTTGTADPVPLVEMGRFSPEATATDPATGIVYETEDSGSSALPLRAHQPEQPCRRRRSAGDGAGRHRRHPAVGHGRQCRGGLGGH